MLEEKYIFFRTYVHMYSIVSYRRCCGKRGSVGYFYAASARTNAINNKRNSSGLKGRIVEYQRLFCDQDKDSRHLGLVGKRIHG